MKRPTPQPKYWLLFLILPVYIGLAWLFTHLALTDTLMEAAQIGTLLLIFFLANRWVEDNQPAFVMADEEEQARAMLKEQKEGQGMNPQGTWLTFQRAGQSLLAALIVLAATLLMALIGRGLLGEGVIALLYLAPIGWATVRWGRLAGAGAALTAALCFDFFFITPYYTFRIGSLEGWLLLILFMTASLVIVGRVMTFFSQAKRRESENNFLYELVILMARLQTREEIAGFIQDQLQAHYQAGMVKVIFYQRGGQPSLLKVHSETASQQFKEAPERSLPIYSGPELIGKITIAQAALPLPGDDDPLLQSICNLVALALDRAQPFAGSVTFGSGVQSDKQGA